jgi:hypothetical protein
MGTSLAPINSGGD